MELQLVSGCVSSVRIVNHSHHVVNDNWLGYHISMFKVDGRPVEIRGAVNLDEGEKIAVIGASSSTGITAFALGSHASGIIVGAESDKRKYYHGLYLLGFGILLSVVLVGLLLVANGAYLMWKYERERAQVELAKAKVSEIIRTAAAPVM